MKTKNTSIIVAIVLGCFQQAPLAGESGVEASARSVTYVTVALNSQGNTYFTDTEIAYELKDFAPPAGPIGVAAMQPAKSLVFTTLPVGWDGDWHPAPRRQYVFMLGGVVEIEVADGAVRRFETGDIILLEDTTGRGHDTRVVGAMPARFAIVALTQAE